MNQQAPENQSRFLQPYSFILQEGSQIEQNLFDYSLLLLQLNPTETIISPSPSFFARHKDMS